jgi:hypothetical protein
MDLDARQGFPLVVQLGPAAISAPEPLLGGQGDIKRVQFAIPIYEYTA